MIKHLGRVSVIALLFGIEFVVPAKGAGSATSSGVPVPTRAITHVMVIDFENQGEGALFGSANSPSYLTRKLEPMGTLISNYFAIGHSSLDNYIAQVSGQAPTVQTSNDCITNTASGIGAFDNLVPGALAVNQALYPGQVVGNGCVYPASVMTIGNQLDHIPHPGLTLTWREYAEDMGNVPSRDGGRRDPLGGTDCAHPSQTNGVGVDQTNVAVGPLGQGSTYSAKSDQYVNRHNPFIYFDSVILHPSYCATHVVPLGGIVRTSRGVRFVGHLATDLSRTSTTPEFSFVSPNVCNDGHDSPCVGPDASGKASGGLNGINDWLTMWMPLILNSPAYRNGSMLVMITSDEGASTDFSAGDGERPGPNNPQPGHSFSVRVAAKTDVANSSIGRTAVSELGGGRVGALILAPRWVKGGKVDRVGSYNHYSALRTFEDLLGIRVGGADGRGHLGFAASSHDFSTGIFSSKPLAN